MSEVFWILGFVVIWLLLQLVILPKFGVNTWMRDACRVEFDAENEKNSPDNQNEGTKI